MELRLSTRFLLAESLTLDTVIAGWLHAKVSKSGSEKTRRAYEGTLRHFRAWLGSSGLDLDARGEQELASLGLLAQAFSTHHATEKTVRPATISQRLAILSSFYEYAIRKKFLVLNPIDAVERPKVQAYAKAMALDQELVSESLTQIDRSTLLGKRNYAVLAVLLQTGRRLSEVVSLQMQHLALHQGKMTLTFHCKGDKEMRDTLSLSAGNAVLAWLAAYYGSTTRPGKKGDERPVWVSLARGPSYGKALGIQSVADVCQKHLGTSKVHVTRHTYAHTMERAGASPSIIQARLGHESLATTGRYLASLNQDENKYGDAVAAMLGIK